MEIISYVLEGALEHRDSLGTGSVIHPGSVQRMTAGTGVNHSEFNHSSSEPVHFLQIWIIPARQGLQPGYDEREFSDQERRNAFCLVASQDGRHHSILVHQDINLYSTLLNARESLSFDADRLRRYWVQVTRGSIELNDELLLVGDGAALVDVDRMEIVGDSNAEFLLFDMA
jgi:hypothetical protein